MAGEITDGPPPQTATPSSQTSSGDPVPDKSFYTWTNFFRILSGSATTAERNQYFLNRDIEREASDCARCETHRDYLFQYSPTVRFLRDEIRALGHDINSENVRCRRCTQSMSGGFDVDYGILLCANQMRNRGHVEDTMAHEMVHAYDHLRFWVDRHNLRHQACTEVSIEIAVMQLVSLLVSNTGL
jgi:mitochondrial inner membrane protease ATP23